MNHLDLTADTQELVGALSAQIGNAQVVALHAPADDDFGRLFRDDESFVDVAERDTLIALRRRSREDNTRFAARIALRYAQIA